MPRDGVAAQSLPHGRARETYPSDPCATGLARHRGAPRPQGIGPRSQLCDDQDWYGGDALAIEIFANLGQWLGAGAASLSAFMDPEVIAIGGGVCDAGAVLLDPTVASFEKHLSARTHRPALARIELARLGNEAGMVGAADLARH